MICCHQLAIRQFQPCRYVDVAKCPPANDGERDGRPKNHLLSHSRHFTKLWSVLISGFVGAETRKGQMPFLESKARCGINRSMLTEYILHSQAHNNNHEIAGSAPIVRNPVSISCRQSLDRAAHQSWQTPIKCPLNLHPTVEHASPFVIVQLL